MRFDYPLNGGCLLFALQGIVTFVLGEYLSYVSSAFTGDILSHKYYGFPNDGLSLTKTSTARTGIIFKSSHLSLAYNSLYKYCEIRIS